MLVDLQHKIKKTISDSQLYNFKWSPKFDIHSLSHSLILEHIKSSRHFNLWNRCTVIQYKCVTNEWNVIWKFTINHFFFISANQIMELIMWSGVHDIKTIQYKRRVSSGKSTCGKLRSPLSWSLLYEVDRHSTMLSTTKIIHNPVHPCVTDFEHKLKDYWLTARVYRLQGIHLFAMDTPILWPERIHKPII